jgi:hypothetical protein
MKFCGELCSVQLLSTQRHRREVSYVLCTRARKLPPPGILTSWLMGIGQSQWGVPIDPFQGGVPWFLAVPVETPLLSGPQFRSAGRRPF